MMMMIAFGIVIAQLIEFAALLAAIIQRVVELGTSSNDVSWLIVVVSVILHGRMLTSAWVSVLLVRGLDLMIAIFVSYVFTFVVDLALVIALQFVSSSSSPSSILLLTIFLVVLVVTDAVLIILIGVEMGRTTTHAAPSSTAKLRSKLTVAAVVHIVTGALAVLPLLANILPSDIDSATFALFALTLLHFTWLFVWIHMLAVSAYRTTASYATATCTLLTIDAIVAYVVAVAQVTAVVIAVFTTDAVLSSLTGFWLLVLFIVAAVGAVKASASAYAAWRLRLAGLVVVDGRRRRRRRANMKTD